MKIWRVEYHDSSAEHFDKRWDSFHLFLEMAKSAADTHYRALPINTYAITTLMFEEKPQDDANGTYWYAGRKGLFAYYIEEIEVKL